MFHKVGSRHRTWRGRAFSLFMSAVLLLGSVPGLVQPAAAAHWATPYLDQLVDWGVMRADQTSKPDTPLTRAEFMAIINRAYGYTEVGPMPFTDVSKSDWFYDDVSIAYNAGYMKGTSKTTASPNSQLTREQAVCILGRNMMMKETPGEDLNFVDSRSISGWARGLVKTAVNNYIIDGYPDDTFRPKANITKGQMAALVTRCVGTPINASGTYALGDVSGNLTITAPNVTLRNTTVTGNLYVSGGVGLGGVKLENVTVLGQIVVSGTGESESGAASVVMRNVNAGELLVDNMRKKYVTVRADGITEIAKTTVRTNAYLEDNNTDDKGLLNITLEGKSGTQLDLAGRIKKVLDKTPNSFIQVAKGSVQSITVDEAAPNTVIQINRNTQVKELNLDVSTNVNGEGDIGKLNVNASGSTVTMLPDEIYIRPGITANINGSVMDSAAAEESSLDPRLLSGYPAANDVSPTGLRADFSGNKKGTVYWAVSSIADGSIGAEQLITPPSYGSKAVRGGSVGLPSGDTVGSTQITGLSVGDSYYLSAVLVDGRGERSPVKVISFTTPDNTKPAFAKGYPYMSLVTGSLAQVTVMPTKTCKLYYAVLPKGANAPTANELRSASVTGNLGYGIVDVVKNTERVINVSNRLQEMKEYTLYLWLTDADGANSSAVTALQFKTVDETAPEFDPDPNFDTATVDATSVKMTAGLNEPGTIYWVAVTKGKAYPPANNNSSPLDRDNIMSGTYDEDGNLVDPNGGTPVSSKLDSEFAKNQVKSHRGASIYGSVKVSKADTEVKLDVTKLKEATAYDFYYVAQDTAGNFSKEVKKFTIQTRDSEGPVVYQYFSQFKGDPTRDPMVTSEVILQFNESISVANTGDLLELYQNASTRSQAINAIRNNFKLWWISEDPTPVPEKSKAGTSLTWVDYDKVVVRAVDNKPGCIEVVFAPKEDKDGNNVGAIQMTSGTQYYFELKGIKDLSGNDPKGKTPDRPITTLTPTECKDTDHVLNIFETVPAWVDLNTHTSPPTAPKHAGETDSGKDDQNKAYARVDASFFMRPQYTGNSDPGTRYDIVILNNGIIDYDLYYRILGTDDKVVTADEVKAGHGLTTATPDAQETNGWVYLGNVKGHSSSEKKWDGVAVQYDLVGKRSTAYSFPNLTQLGEGLRYEFAISVTKKDNQTNYGLWRNSVDFRAYVVSGGSIELRKLMSNTSLQPEDIKDFHEDKDEYPTGRSIGSYRTQDFVQFPASFGGNAIPTFRSGPFFEAGVSDLNIQFQLEGKGYVYYAISDRENRLGTEITMKAASPAGSGVTWTQNEKIASTPKDDKLWSVIDVQTKQSSPGTLLYTVTDDMPPVDDITNDRLDNYRRGSIYYSGSGNLNKTICQGTNANEIKDYMLEAKKDYYIYLVVTDIAGRPSEMYIYNFTTANAQQPKITVRDEEDGRITFDTMPGDPGSEENVETTLRWRVFTELDADRVLGTLGTFSVADALTNGKDKNGNTVTGYKTITTVLGALTTEYKAADAYGTVPANPEFGEEYNGRSVFDVFAGSKMKRDLYNIIFSGSGGSISNGEASTLEKNSFTDTATWYKDSSAEMDTPYVVLAMGHNSVYDRGTSSSIIKDWSTVESFVARTKVTNRNMKGPQLKGENGATIAGGISSVFDNTGGKTYSGGVTITFDQGLYSKVGGSGAPLMVQPGKNPGNGSTIGILYNYESTTPFTENATTGPSITTSGNPGTTPRDNFTIQFNKVPATTITLQPDNVLCSERGNPTNSKITVSIIDEEVGTTVKRHEIWIEVSLAGKTQKTKIYSPNP